MLTKKKLNILLINPFILAGSSGLLLIFCFSPYDISFLAWCGLVPLLISLEDKKPGTAFWLGYTQGLIFTLGTLFWIKIFHFMALPSMLLVLSFYFGAFAWIYAFLNKKFNIPKPIIAAISWTAIEYLRSLGFLGFTWNSLGYTQYQNIYLIQFVKFTGIYGLSFLIVLVNTYIAQIILGKNNIKSLWIYTSLIVAALLYGKFSIPQKLDINKDTRELNIGIIQGNFESELTDDFYKLPILKTLTNKLSNPDLIIWTETVLLNGIEDNLILKREINDITKNKKSFLLVGNPTIEYQPDGSIKDFNSAYLINPNGEVLEHYNKIHLVPFGEVFPFHHEFEFIRELEAQVDCGGFEAGEKITIFELNEKNRNARFATLICYEAIFGDLTREFVNNGAEFLVNITNDSWSKSVSSHAQHASMSIFRAIENNVYLVRAANTGISFFVDPYGRIYSKLDVYKKGFIEAKIFVNNNKKTFYTKYGDIFAKSIVIILGALFLISFKKVLNS